MCIPPPVKHADVPGADPNHPLACQHSSSANWQQQKQNPVRRRQDLYLLCSEWMAKEGLSSAQGCSEYREQINAETGRRGRQEVKGRQETVLFAKSQILNRTTWAQLRTETSRGRTPKFTPERCEWLYCGLNEEARSSYFNIRSI